MFNDLALLALVHNAALLLALCIVYDLLPLRAKVHPRAQQAIVGIMVGTIGIGVMLTPWQLQPGVIFDTRSIILSISGLFFGFVPAAIAVGMTAAVRVAQGGAGAPVGVAVIVTSAALGLVWQRRLQQRGRLPTWLGLYVFGLVVHVAMLLWMLALPWPIPLTVLPQITLPVLLIYPLVTLALGVMLLNRRNYVEAQRTLARSAEHSAILSNLLQHSSQPFGVGYPDGSIGVFNDAFLNLVGYSREEMKAMDWLVDLTPPEWREFELAQMAALERSGEPVRYEKEYMRKDGSRVPIELLVHVVRDEGGRPRYYYAFVTDISERKRAGELLQLQGAALNAAANAIVVTDLDARIQWVNPAFSALTGYTAEEALGKNPRDLIKSGQHDKAFYRDLWDTILSGRVWRGEIINRRKDGTLYTEEQTITPLRGDNGEITRFIAIKQDVTERKAAEAERAQLVAQVQDQALHVEQIINTVPQGVLLIDRQGRVIMANPMARSDLAVLAGVGEGDVLTHLGDRPLRELLKPSPRGLWHEVKAGTRTFEITARPTANGEGAESWVLVINDATQQRHMRKQLQQQEQLAAVGHLAAGIAHDFNNIMAVITLYAQMSARVEDLSARGRERMQTILQQAQHASQLIQQILDFSRRTPLELRPLDLLLLLKEQVRLLERTLPEHIRIELIYGRDEYTINGDATRIQQMVTNLAVNAREAMPYGGNLTFELARLPSRSSDGLGHSDCVRLTISDSGSGIPDEVLPHIFEPFFTTRAPGKGSGLGLAQVHGIVGQHNGQIEVRSRPGQGTVFTVQFPALPVKAADVSVQPVENLPMGHGQEVLVVEDGESVRGALVESLRRLDYQVVEAANGQEALAVLNDPHQRVDLVLSDVIMPVMGGIDLLQILRQQGNETPLIFLTGHPTTTEFQAMQAQIPCTWLTKPPDLAQLAQTIASVLHAPAPTEMAGRDGLHHLSTD